jgi:hypothetical protein
MGTPPVIVGINVEDFLDRRMSLQGLKKKMFTGAPWAIPIFLGYTQKGRRFHFKLM